MCLFTIKKGSKPSHPCCVTFDAFMEELRNRYLDPNWDSIMTVQLHNNRQCADQTFEAWEAEITATNTAWQ